MKHRDELDRKHAALFAWRTTKEAEKVDLPSDDAMAAPKSRATTHPAPAAVEIPVNADVDIDVAVEQARPECLAIEREVALAWSLSGDAQLKATRGILHRVAKIGVALIGIGKQPSVRLARLVTRHYRGLSPTQRSDCGYIFGLDLSHPECADLVVEAADGHADVVSLMTGDGDRSERPAWASPVCAARLAAIVENAPKAKVRAAALELASHCALGDACPILRRALRRPEWPLRALAAKLLHELTELNADDCLCLLEASTLPRPRRYTNATAEALSLCDATLREALPTVRPVGGEDALLRVLFDERLAFSPWLGAPWALDMLAATYPARALEPIDRRLRADGLFERIMAISALEALPEDEARPRLVMAAGDPSPAVADRARSIYHSRFGVRCPSAELAGIATELLVEAPSRQFLSRLGVLRVISNATRAAWAAALLAEAPDPEPLALLVFLLGGDIGEALPSRPVPVGTSAWSKELLARFGTSAINGLFALGARFPFSTRRGWLAVLGDRVEDGTIGEGEWARVRAFAEAVLARGPTNEGDARRLLALTALRK
jgi:hypothetical protein